VVTPTEPLSIIQPDFFIPVKEDGNRIVDQNTKVEVAQTEDGNLHITITAGDTEGPIYVGIQPGGLVDLAGNENNPIILDTPILVDNTAPTIIDIQKPADGTIIKKEETITVTITPSETVTTDTSKYIVTGEGAAHATLTVAENPDGTITLTIIGGEGTGNIGIELQPGAFIDEVGNVNATISIENVVKIDNSSPTVEAQVTAQTTNAITVQVQAEDIGAAGLATENTYTYHLVGDGVEKTITTTETTCTFTGLPQGLTCTITVTAIDKKGNKGTDTITAATGTVPIGNGNITASTLTWNENGSKEQEGTAKITLTNSKTDYTMQYQIVAEEGSIVESNWQEAESSTLELDGLKHKDIVYARLIDETGNAGNATSTSILDNIAPNAGTITMKKGDSTGTDYTHNTWTNQNVYIELLEGSDAQSGVQSDAITNATGTITMPTTLSEEGTHTITVTTTDWAGLTASNSYHIQIDKTKPSLPTLTASNTAPTNTDITITGTSTDTVSGIAGYQYTMADNLTAESTGWTDITATTESFTAPAYTVSSNGIYYFYVKDQAGNIHKQFMDIQNIDKTPPTITAIGAPSATYIKKGQTVTYSITTSETVTVADASKATVTGAGSAGCSVSITGSGTNFTATVTGGTGNGAVSLNLAAGVFTDAVGNATTVAATKAGLTIDNTAPTISVVNASGTVVKSRNITVTISDAGSGLASSPNTTYYVSSDASNPKATGYQTGSYTSGTAFAIGAGLTGSYYLFIPVIADNVGNTSTQTITGYYRCGTYVFDNTGPTITKVTVADVNERTFTLTVTATDVGSAGLSTASDAYTLYYKQTGKTTYTNKPSSGNNCVTGRLFPDESALKITTDTTNAPTLKTGMNPVIWVNGTEIVKYSNVTSKTINSAWTANNGDAVWGKYKKGEPTYDAYVVVKDALGNETTSSNVSVTIPKNLDHKASNWANVKMTDGSYFVWVPRYAYKITQTTSTSSGSTNRGTIDVKFMNGTGNTAYDGTACKVATSNISTTSQYVVHPAFCSNVNMGGYGTNLTGIWVAKYKASGNASKIKFVPDAVAFRNVTIGNCYTYSYNYNRSLDSHFIKNSEWGAVCYLAHSQYGRNSFEIAANDSSGYYTGRSAGDMYIDTPTTAGSYKYNTAEGGMASTTGNTTGVYDLTGSAMEYVCCWNKTCTDTRLISNGSSFAKANGSSTKYATAYNCGNNTSINSSLCILGDATYEIIIQDTATWFNDFLFGMDNSDPYLARADICYSDSNSQGMFVGGKLGGEAAPEVSFRAVIPG